MQGVDFPAAAKLFWAEIAVRVVLITTFVITENVDPFWRKIQQEEVWLYSYPNSSGYVTTLALYMIVISVCLAVVALFFALNRNFREAWDALLVPSFAIPLCGTITNFIKISVGRPRPDYFARCLPGIQAIDVAMACTGNLDTVMEGRKSFPSGHSSMSFCAMGFVSLYLAGKLGVFNSRGRGQAWRMIVVLVPVVAAMMIAISRTCDYHHHWQDVTVGSIIGVVVVYVVYRQYYPSLSHGLSHLPYSLLPTDSVNIDSDPILTNSHRINMNKGHKSFSSN